MSSEFNAALMFGVPFEHQFPFNGSRCDASSISTNPFQGANAEGFVPPGCEDALPTGDPFLERKNAKTR